MTVIELVRCFLFVYYSFLIVNLINWFVQGERKISILVGISLAFTIHVIGVYWWYQNDGLLYPLIMLPPRAIPPFWHAIFIIMVNGNLLLKLLLIVTVCSLIMISKRYRSKEVVYYARLPSHIIFCNLFIFLNFF